MAKSTSPKKKKSSLDAMAGTDDPRAALDSAALLDASRKVLARLEDDLRQRAEASPAVTRGLRDQYEREKAAERTAETFAGWSAALATQVAAAWLLSCVFVRTLEDRGLLRQARIAGPGAMDSQRLFFQLAPSLTERDYLLMVWKELAQYPAARGLFDAEHSLVWKLSPSAEMAKELLALFRTPTAEAPAFRFGQASTRFLGDLYQDLSEDVRKRYALLQTPDFVESFILDRTLEPAVVRFGLDDTTVIDPTCGSGHFLLGAFGRLFEHRRRLEPGVDARVAAVKAVDVVYGADINPYAVAIARFRLTLEVLEKAGYGKLADAPALPLHVVVADSLRLNPAHGQRELWEQADAGAAQQWVGTFALEDGEAAKDVLMRRRYAAVVGNPPYITEKDPAKREVYRKMYVSAAGKYALSAPFCERFFQLARDRGYCGQITANSFMKREFGKKLIEEYLPTVNLELIVNTSGAYIPGHGTPTVLLFGTQEKAVGRDVLAVLAKRGEPSTPENPAEGKVWRSVVEHWEEVGYEDEYLSVARVGRDGLEKHPWSLGGGGASELKELLEERAERRLGDVVESIGIASFTLEDDVFLRPEDAWLRAGVPKSRLRKMIIGEAIRDWSIGDVESAFFPYDDNFRVISETSPELKALWPWKTCLANSKLFGGKTKIEGGLKWHEFGRLTADKLRTPMTITFAFVATHNHFVLDRGGSVFNRSAPIIKLNDQATEDDHYSLLAYLNSSTACFWMKQVFYPKATTTGDISTEKGRPEANRFEFAGTGLEPLPLPPVTPESRRGLSELASLASEQASQRDSADANRVIALLRGRVPLAAALREVDAARQRAEARLLHLQDRIDWQIYAAFGLASSAAASFDTMAQTAEAARVAAVETSADLRIMEDPMHKRPWSGRRGVFGHGVKTLEEAVHDVAKAELEAAAEALLSKGTVPLSLAVLARATVADATSGHVVAEVVGGDAEVRSCLADGAAVPFLAAARLSESGLATWSEWAACWDLQRREDAGETVGSIEPPPKYKPTDFLEARYFRLRGKLDVPKERFISYPGCESDDDGEPVYGWAGWDHLQRAQALAALYMDRKTREGWPRERLVPMLAGLLELIPWVKQWHNEPSAEYDGLRMGDYFAQFLDGELRLHSLTPADLRAWRPAKKSRTKSKPTAAPAADDVAASDAPPPKPKRPRKPKPSAAE
jgi:hypothetical protein